MNQSQSIFKSLNKSLAQLKKIQKDRASIFAVSEKESIAEWFGLPLNTFYHLPFSTWIEISENFDKVLDDISENFQKISKFNNISNNWLYSVPFNEMKDLYYIWAKETHRPIWHPLEGWISNSEN